MKHCVKLKLLGHNIILLFSVFLFVSCADNIAEDEHYKSRESNGNAYEVLKSEGNYSIFLSGIDLSGYKNIVDGKTVMTVMAPDDSAFTSFLLSKGYSSINDLYQKDPQYLKRLIGFHLVYYAFDWNKLVNFRPTEGDGATESQKELLAGYYYKHRTHSRDTIEQERVKLTSNATSDTLLSIYHYDRYLPVFSDCFFNTKGIDPAYNYEYFYPHSKWNSSSVASKGYFNISNAQVSDKNNVVTDNGYLYHITQVLEPLNTIYDELKSRSKYSEFLNLYNNYSTYVQADAQTNTSLGYIAYIHKHGDLPSIACEWPTTDYTKVDILERQGYNLFAPSNQAIHDFFKTYWDASSGYSSLENLDPLILKYFIYQSFGASDMIVFPEEIKKDSVLTFYGTPVNINPDEVTDRIICENGAFYGMDHIQAPAIFSSVAGPAFKSAKYVDYLYALDGSNLVLSLASTKSDFVTLMPSNIQMENCDPAIRLYTTTSGRELQQYSNDAGDYVAMSGSAKLNLVNMHVAPNISALPASGTHVIQTNTSFNYWYMHDGKITTNSLFNQQLSPTYEADPWVNVSEITDNGSEWSNGRSYRYDASAVFHPVSGDALSHILSVANDKTYDYYLFAQLLQKAGLISDGGLNTSILPSVDTRFFVFVPTNEAIRSNIKNIPGCSSLRISDDGMITGYVLGSNKSKLASYLRNYFVTSTMNAFSAYPYVGSTCKGIFFTTGNYKMTINDNGSKISVHLNGSASANSVDVSEKYYGLPFVFTDGSFQFIKGILL